MRHDPPKQRPADKYPGVAELYALAAQGWEGQLDTKRAKEARYWARELSPDDRRAYLSNTCRIRTTVFGCLRPLKALDADGFAKSVSIHGTDPQLSIPFRAYLTQISFPPTPENLPTYVYGARENIGSCHDAAVWGELVTDITNSFWVPLGCDARTRFAEMMIAIARDRYRTLRTVWFDGLNLRGWCCAERGNLSAMEDCIRESYKIACQGPSEVHKWISGLAASACFTATGQFDKARRCLDRVPDTLRTDESNGFLLYGIQEHLLAVLLHDVTPVRRPFDEFADRRGLHRLGHCLRAFLWAEGNDDDLKRDRDKARRLVVDTLRDDLASLRGRQAFVFANAVWASVCSSVDMPEYAEILLANLKPHELETVVVVPVAILPPVAFFMGLLYKLTGDFESAMACYDKALATAGAGSPWRALVQVYLAEALSIRSERHAESTSHLSAASGAAQASKFIRRHWDRVRSKLSAEIHDDGIVVPKVARRGRSTEWQYGKETLPSRMFGAWYAAFLVEHPEEIVSARDLQLRCGLPQPQASPARDPDTPGETAPLGDAGSPLSRTISWLEREIDDLQKEEQEAVDAGRSAKASRARESRQDKERQLKELRSMGNDQSDQVMKAITVEPPSSSPKRKAWDAVRRAIERFIEELESNDCPTLAQHLRVNVDRRIGGFRYHQSDKGTRR